MKAVFWKLEDVSLNKGSSEVQVIGELSIGKCCVINASWLSVENYCLFGLNQQQHLIMSESILSVTGFTDNKPFQEPKMEGFN